MNHLLLFLVVFVKSSITIAQLWDLNTVLLVLQVKIVPHIIVTEETCAVKVYILQGIW